MPPGTPHAVVTLEDSVSFGGMYYLPSMYSETLNAILDLHTHGQRLTNSDVPGAHLYLFHLVGYYFAILNMDGWFPQGKDLIIPDGDGFSNQNNDLRHVYNRLQSGTSGFSSSCP